MQANRARGTSAIRVWRALSTAVAFTGLSASVHAAPIVLDPALTVGTVSSGLSQPTGMAFIAPNDMFVLEKATGRVQRVVNGVVQGTVLDLPVNSNSERGLLGMALAPDFATATNPSVYLYWTESSTGADSNAVGATPLLGNRVDRFSWNGSTLAFDRNLIQLRARQTDNLSVPGHPGTQNASERGNHNGGVIRFGSDKKLYVEIGDVGRRSQLQNLTNGPFATPPRVDDTFGGPAPDSFHFTGAVLRLNPDGTTPADNPFFAAGAAIGGEVGANIQKLYAYGMRNSFGMAFDPVSNALWMAENGDDAFDELNRVVPAMNGGWVQAMGPLSRIDQYKEIETTLPGGLQQVRWDASNIPTNATDAMNALFLLPGASYSDPEFSWKYGVAPSALGFQTGSGLGAEYDGNLFVGAARTTLHEGYLFRFLLDVARTGIDASDPRLADLVADNLAKFDDTESESLLFGTGFGAVTDIQTGPNGNLFVLSLSDGAIYEISRLAVPEPGALALLALGAIVLTATGRKARSTAGS
jgi:aldose sugar dehydrogenase